MRAIRPHRVFFYQTVKNAILPIVVLVICMIASIFLFLSAILTVVPVVDVSVIVNVFVFALIVIRTHFWHD